MKNLINKIILSTILLISGAVFGSVFFPINEKETNEKILISFDIGYEEGYHKATEDLAYMNQFNTEKQ